MPHPLREKSYVFALDIIQICKKLDEKKAYAISKQLLRSGTSIGANIEEAQQAQSKADFISKYSISLKEAVETEYWLKLIRDSETLEVDSDVLEKVREIQRILTASIKTTKAHVQK